MAFGELKRNVFDQDAGHVADTLENVFQEPDPTLEEMLWVRAPKSPPSLILSSRDLAPSVLACPLLTRPRGSALGALSVPLAKSLCGREEVKLTCTRTLRTFARPPLPTHTLYLHLARTCAGGYRERAHRHLLGSLHAVSLVLLHAAPA